jgi:hypothetical protein
VGHLIGRRVLSRAEWLDVAGCKGASTLVEICIGLQPLAAPQGQGVIGGPLKPVLHHGQGWAIRRVGGSP